MNRRGVTGRRSARTHAASNGRAPSPRHEMRTEPAAERRPGSRRAGWLERFAQRITDWAGGSLAFVLACALVVGWLVTGPLFHFSNTWQLVINTGTTIVTFLMVFLIQRAQNKESRAIALKLNELIAAKQGASSRLIDVESLSEDELEALRDHYRTMVQIAKREGSMLESHSIEEAGVRQGRKQSLR